MVMTSILDTIESPDALQDLNKEQLAELAGDLRSLIIDVVSRNGGHLASNLGVIELTISLLRQFDFQRDKIIWDVGHQSYAYKILTGRKDAFETLRQKGGISGFPKRDESSYDSFNTGHSATSISAALGIARGMRLREPPRKGKVIAVIGDGAMTGGLAYEALNNIDPEDKNLLIILNDNQMSIDANVGSLSRHLDKIRVAPRYIKFKSRLDTFISRIPKVGKSMGHFFAGVKNRMRKRIQPKNILFEALGLRYYGPIDGHDPTQLDIYLKAVQQHAGPVLLHVCTQKGKGYLPAEEEPDIYHGVAPFEVETGIAPRLAPNVMDSRHPMAGCGSFTDAFTMSLMALAEQRRNVVAVTAAMSSGTGLLPFAERFPKRFFDVDIAEQHAVTMAAGLAAGGLIPIVAMYSTFIQRAIDQVLHDVALQKLHVVFAIDRAGIVGTDGETHQGVYDRAMLMAVPGAVILEPRDYASLKQMLFYAVEDCRGPVFIRYPRGVGQCPAGYRAGASNTIAPPLPFAEVVRTGGDITIVSAGNMTGFAVQAALVLEEDNIYCEVVDCRAVKPLDLDTILFSARSTGALLVLEEVCPSGSVASEIALALTRENRPIPFRHLSVGDHAVAQATQEEAWSDEGLDVAMCVATARELHAEKRRLNQ